MRGVVDHGRIAAVDHAVVDVALDVVPTVAAGKLFERQWSERE